MMFLGTNRAPKPRAPTAASIFENVNVAFLLQKEGQNWPALRTNFAKEVVSLR